MELKDILTIVTILVSYGLGILSKKSTFIKDEMIPLQNISVGVIIAIIEFIITKDFDTSIALSGLIAGGTYDIIHNLDKIVHKTEDK